VYVQSLSTALDVQLRLCCIANILETAGQITKSSKLHPQTLLLDILQGMIIGFKLYRKNIFGLRLNAIFEIVKMNFGSKSGAWVSFHIAILQS